MNNLLKDLLNPFEAKTSNTHERLSSRVHSSSDSEDIVSMLASSPFITLSLCLGQHLNEIEAISA